MNRVLLFFAATTVFTLVLALEFARHQLSPRELGIGLLIVCISGFAALMFIVRNPNRKLNVQPGPPATSIDAFTRKHLIWRIRKAKITIAIMLLALVVGLSQIRHLPIGPLLVGLAINLLTTAISIETVVRLRKILQ